MNKPTKTTDGDNAIKYMLNGVPHREDGPAVRCADGSRFWYVDGYLHRTDGPAIESANGDKFWYRNGKLHRTDGPAIMGYNNGAKYWFINGIEINSTNYKKFQLEYPELIAGFLNKTN